LKRLAELHSALQTIFFDKHTGQDVLPMTLKRRTLAVTVTHRTKNKIKCKMQARNSNGWNTTSEHFITYDCEKDLDILLQSMFTTSEGLQLSRLVQVTSLFEVHDTNNQRIK
jgi:hypothetical protein